ncbi:MAG TPA: nucleoside triphosphate pyrophosphatase [Steroidobacteraceae bacterium]
MPRLILASSSPYRRALLQRLGVPFESLAPELTEGRLADELPSDRAVRLSLAKAHAIATRHPDATIIGSDQVAAVGNDVLDKPGGAAACRAQLSQLSGKVASFHTGCAVVTPRQRLVHLDTTQVSFRALTSVEIARYVEREAPFDCAGGFKAEALGISLFDAVESADPTALIGLPLIWLAGALRQAGYAVP